MIRHILLWSVLSLYALGGWAQAAQTAESPDSLHEELESRMKEYIEELNHLALVCDMQLQFSETTPLTDTYVKLVDDKIKLIDENLKSIDFRWTTFSQAMQMDVVDDEELMDMMTQVQLQKQVLTDTINSKRQQCKALADFVKAQHLLFEKDSVYNHLYRTAFQLSLIQKAAPKLEKVKAKEQELFAQLQTTYDGAKNAVTLIPSLAQSMENLDEKFAKYKVMSEKIQAMEYKPFIQRIKDYLIGLACVAIIILFFNLILSKLQALKKARQAAKQYQEALDRQGGGVYPTI